MKVLFGVFLLIAVLTSLMWRDTFDPESIRGARVLITGASSGIGEQMAYHYAKFGAEIVITARRLEALKKVTQKCEKLGAKKIMYVTGDMSDPADPGRVLKYTIEKLGGLDFLVLNHVGNTNVGLWNRDADHVRSLMQVNFVSYVQMAGAALPVLETSSGSIIVVSSLADLIDTDNVLLASSNMDLQHALGQFAAECDAAGMRISTSKSETMVLHRKKLVCHLQVGGKSLPKVEEFKYLWILFTSEGRMEREIDRRIGAAAVVMRLMYRSVVVKKELSRKALSYCHLWS